MHLVAEVINQSCVHDHYIANTFCVSFSSGKFLQVRLGQEHYTFHILVCFTVIVERLGFRFITSHAWSGTHS